MLVGRQLNGRKQIFTNETVITDGNVLNVLNTALPEHQRNRADIEYLEKYLRGIQPILDRKKTANEAINNKIVVNLAKQIVTFSTANFAGEPIQYVSRGGKEEIPEKIDKLNAMLLSEGKYSKDVDLAFKMFTSGVSYRLVIHDRGPVTDYVDEAPFEIYVPDPANTFVVRTNDVSKRVVMGVTYVFLDSTKSNVRYTVYTKDVTYTVEGTVLRAEKITNIVRHNFGMVTLVEYPCNPVYMGAFEVVHDLLNAYSLLESNRVDGVEQKVDSLLVLQGVEADKNDLMEMRDLGAIKIPPNNDGGGQSVYFISADLDQSQTQTLVDNLYQEILQIVGMPSQGNANTSDSSNNGAVILKNGWWNAESRALETEGMWTVAETEFLKIILKICRDAGVLDGLAVSDMKLKFGRRSYEDKLTKTQTFATMIGVGAPPIQAYTVSGMLTDPEAAAIAFEEYQAKIKQEEEASLAKELEDARTQALRTGRQSNIEAELPGSVEGETV